MRTKDIVAGRRYVTRTGYIVRAERPYPHTRAEWIVTYLTGPLAETGKQRAIQSARISHEETSG